MVSWMDQPKNEEPRKKETYSQRAVDLHFSSLVVDHGRELSKLGKKPFPDCFQNIDDQTTSKRGGIPCDLPGI